MLTEAEKKEIHEEMELYPYPTAAVIDALKIVQQHKGWISDEAIADIASELGMSTDEVDGIATFYTRIYRKPVGRNVILICDSISCMVMDYESLYNYISGKLGIKFGETTPDRRFTLLPVSCLGDCDNAPVMMVNSDTHNRLTRERIDSILERYL
ncbi:MAG TPA: NADH-quinone oxidoreductase subunit NuoE [Bacteroidales bacterium]|jgi:NADH-quinone oxidoreductase subunit E|nr:NADH-quinone oxidoreductase subunit NuoE [Bacteroidales bacterium]